MNQSRSLAPLGIYRYSCAHFGCDDSTDDRLGCRCAHFSPSLGLLYQSGIIQISLMSIIITAQREKQQNQITSGEKERDNIP